MSSVEQRARELLAAEYQREGIKGVEPEVFDADRAALRAIAAALREQSEARGVVDDAMVERVLHTRVPGGSEVWHWIDGGGMEVTPAHRRIAEVVIKAYIAQTLGKPIHQQEHEAALTAAQQPGQEGGGEQERNLPKLVVTRGDGIPLPDQSAALEEFKRQCLRAAPPSAPVGVEDKARAMFEAQADNLAAPWDRQWEPTKDFWRKCAAVALTQQPAQAAPGDDEYRLLRRGDVVQADDEVLHDNCTRWIELAGWEIGMVYDPLVFVPVRRKAPTPPGDDAAGGGHG